MLDHMASTGAQSLWQRRASRVKRPITPLHVDAASAQQSFCRQLDDTSSVLSGMFTIKGYVGSGSTSTVMRAVRKADGQHVALKTMRSHDAEMLLAARNEFTLLRTAEHPNIVRVLDLVTLPTKFVLVMELFDGMELCGIVRATPCKMLTEKVTQHLSAALANAISYLHMVNIIHRDINPRNVLVSEDCSQLKLVDLNAASEQHDGSPLTPTGDKLFAAPEVVCGGSPCALGDIWGFGLCAHHALSGRLPQDRDAWRKGNVTLIDSDKEVTLEGPRWSGISEPCKVLLKRCLAVAPSSRPEAAELMSSLWLQAMASLSCFDEGGKDPPLECGASRTQTPLAGSTPPARCIPQDGACSLQGL